MTEKKLLQDYTENILISYYKNKGIDKKENMPMYHVNGRARRFQKKNFPDLFFTYNNKYYFLEFGISGRHMDRKKRQLDYMKNYYDESPSVTECHIFFSQEAILLFFKDIGIL